MICLLVPDLLLFYRPKEPSLEALAVLLRPQRCFVLCREIMTAVCCRRPKPCNSVQQIRQSLLTSVFRSAPIQIYSYENVQAGRLLALEGVYSGNKDIHYSHNNQPYHIWVVSVVNNTISAPPVAKDEQLLSQTIDLTIFMGTLRHG